MYLSEGEMILLAYYCCLILIYFMFLYIDIVAASLHFYSDFMVLLIAT